MSSKKNSMAKRSFMNMRITHSGRTSAYSHCTPGARDRAAASPVPEIFWPVQSRVLPDQMCGCLNMKAAAFPMSTVETNCTATSAGTRNFTLPLVRAFQLAASSKFSKKATGRRMAKRKPDALKLASMSTFDLALSKGAESASTPLAKTTKTCGAAALMASMMTWPCSISLLLLPPAAVQKSVRKNTKEAWDSFRALVTPSAVT
mmetsp:Transcript_57136/g.102677  ORF Transcript_57136/g.102677 Transcript_57136/m.102677 type:complete len:204 (+) Transcript_57136:290-901(+)